MSLAESVENGSNNQEGHGTTIDPKAQRADWFGVAVEIVEGSNYRSSEHCGEEGGIQCGHIDNFPVVTTGKEYHRV